MSFSEVRPYFRSRLNTVSGLKEWEDAFNVNNIPSTVLDEAYHIATISGSALKMNHQVSDHEFVVTIRWFKKGFRNPADALDTAMQRIDDIYDAVLLPSARSTETGLINVLPGNIIVDPLSDDNDNIVVVSLDFNCLISLDITD